VGFKASEGRLPDAGRGSVPIGQQAIPSQLGLLARKVEDIVLAFGIVTGSAVPESSGAEAIDLARLVVGKFVDDGTFAPCAAAVRAVNEAAEALGAAGATVVSFDLPRVEEVADLFYGILAGDGGRGISRFLAGTKKDPRIAQLLLAGSVKGPVRAALLAALRVSGRRKAADLIGIYGNVHTGDYWDRVERLVDYRASFLEALDSASRPIDVILSPACALPAPKHGATADLAVMGTYTSLYNVLGYPAGVVPFTRVRPGEETKTARGRDRMDRTAAESEKGSAGLPVGVQIAARHGQDDTALAVMSAVQAAAERRPDYPQWSPMGAF
jgi:fatty acid amide hydrolase